MKYLLPIIFFILACSEPLTFEERINKNIEAYFSDRLDDPSSFEFVKIEDLDTLTIKDFWNAEIRLTKISYNGHQKNKSRIDEIEKTSKELMKFKEGKEMGRIGLEEVADSRKEGRRLKARLDSFNMELAAVKNDTIKEYQLMCFFRANNKSGAKELNQYYIRLAPDESVMSASKQ